LTDLLMVATFETIKECFKTQEMSKLAYIYIAQCFSLAILPFCLELMLYSTNDKGL